MARSLTLAYAAFLAAALWSLPAALSSAEPRDPYAHFFQPTFGDFSEELEDARAKDLKGVLIFFELEECPFCLRMRQQVLNQPEVQDFFREHFAIFSVDVGGDVEITDFQGNKMREADFAVRQHRVRATPVLQFFDLDGEPIVRFTGATRDVRELLQLGEFVANGHYRQMDFARFQREGP